MKLLNHINLKAYEFICPFCNLKLGKGAPNILAGSLYNDNIDRCMHCTFEAGLGVGRGPTLRWKPIYNDFICGIDFCYNSFDFTIWHKYNHDDDTLFYIRVSNNVIVTELYGWRKEMANNLDTIEDLNSIIEKLVKEQVFQ